MDEQLPTPTSGPGPFIRHVQTRQTHHTHQKRCADGGVESSGSTTRWSFGRCSVRGLATLLKRGQNKQHQKQHQQLSCLSNDLNMGNHAKAKKEHSDELKPKIRTTVLGRPVPPPPPPPAVKLPASPLYQMKRRLPRSHQQQNLQQCPQQYLQPLECIPDDEFDKSATLNGDNRPMSLLLELDGELRRVALIGWQRSLRCLSDIWSLFASQWPAAVPALGPNWRVSVLSDGTRNWVALKEDQLDGLSALANGARLKLERATSCSCSCTCPNSCGGSSSASSSSTTSVSCSSQQQRIDRLEAQVTSLTRRLGVPDELNGVQVEKAIEEGAVGKTVKCQSVLQSPHQGKQSRAQRLQDIRDECRRLRDTRDAIRRDHERRVRETRQMLSDLACDVRRILSGAATMEATGESAESSQRRLVEAELRAYQSERAEVSALIDDIDETTGELRHDVLRRRCRSNPAEVELLALHLSRATQRLASLKNRFPDVQNRTRDLLRQETQTVAEDERVLVEEEAKLEGWLRKVKKLTMMLYTFKQLADAQAKETPTLLPFSVPECSTDEAEEARRDLLQGVLSVCPDHERRSRAIERAEAGIERRRRMLREAAALKAEKTLTTAAGRLKAVRGVGYVASSCCRQEVLKDTAGCSGKLAA